ncbi:MAG TPA: helix-hairpin-helix domain-containing protein [Leptolinea sp.]
MNTDQLLTFLNNSSREELTTLPGIGLSLSDRILEARPFNTLEDAKVVKGIGGKLLESWVDIPAAQPDSVVDSLPITPNETPVESRFEDLKDTLTEKGQTAREALAEFGESAKKRGQATRLAVEALPQKLDETARTRGPLWTTLVSSIITALLAILLTLVILASINGSLSFATNAQYRTLNRELTQLTEQANTMQKDMNGLRVRIDTLEGLGERTVALEKAQTKLAADQKTASQQMTALQAEVTVLTEKVTKQEEQTQRFETFLKDLQTLLGNLFTPQGETK